MLHPLLGIPDVSVATSIANIPDDNPIPAIGDNEPAADNLTTATADSHPQHSKKQHIQKPDEVIANVPTQYKAATQGIAQCNLGDKITVDDSGEKEFILTYPNGNTAHCKTTSIAAGSYYIDYEFDAYGHVVIPDHGLPDIKLKTQQEYSKDAAVRDQYTQQQVSSTMHT